MEGVCGFRYGELRTPATNAARFRAAAPQVVDGPSLGQAPLFGAVRAIPSVIPIAKPQTEEQVLRDTHSHRRSASVTSSLWIACLVLIGVLLVPRAAAAQGCQEVGCDEEPPVVTPSFDPAVLPAVTMRITWCDNEWLMPATRTITLNGSNVVGSFTYSSQSGSCASQAFSVATMNLNPGTTYTLFATIEDEHGNIGTGSAQFTTPNGWVVVEPKGLTVERPQQSSNLSQQFIVKNPASVANNFRLARTCLGQVSTCSTVPDTIHLDAGDDTTISVTYNTGLISSGTSGTLRLRARMTTDTTVADSTDVTVNLLSSLIVDDSPTNNDAQNFGLCAYACFANIYTQSTVPYFSLDQPRGVTLVYNHLRVWEKPYLLFNVSTLPGAPTVDKLKLTVRDSVTGAAIRVQGDNNNDPGVVYFRRDTGTVRLATLIWDSSWLPAHGTGIHPVQVTVTAIRSGFADEADTLFVPVLVVRERPGAVARGWYVGGIQRVIPQSGGRVIVVEPDGSAFVYTATDTLGSYQAPEGEFSVLSRSGSGTNAIYTRAYPDSGKVRFDYQGQMLDASDSWGKKIRYTYDVAGRPTRIYDPLRTRPDSTAAPSAYIELVYYADSVLIRPPQADGSSFDASRVTRLRVASDSTLRAVVDPDGDSTRFTYKSGVLPWPYQDRKVYLENVYDRSGTLRANFSYDFAAYYSYVGSQTLQWTKAASVPYYTGNGNTMNTQPGLFLYDWRGRGIPTLPTSSTSLGSPAGLDTLYSEARDAVSHQSFGRHDRWGQLLQFITHNKKDTTRYFRTGLFADSVRNPIGTMDRFTYTLLPGGRLALASSTPAGQSGTFYAYDSLGRLSNISGASTPTVAITRHGVANPAHIDQVFVAGIGTTLVYDSLGRVKTSVDPGGHIVQYLFDDTFGNTRKVLYEGTRFDSVRFDAYGRDSIFISTAAAKRFVNYDTLNRVRRDSVAGATGATVYGYDKEYLVRVVDPQGQVFKREVNALGWTRKVYDPADTTKYVRHEYTAEGLPALFVNRRGQWKEMTYWGDDNRHLLTATNTDTNFIAATYGYGYRMNGNVRTGTFITGTNRMATDTMWFDVHGRLESVITRIAANRGGALGSTLGQRRFIRSYAWSSDGLLQSVALETRQAIGGQLIRSFTPRYYWWNTTTRLLDSISLGGVAASAALTRDVYERKDSTWMFTGQGLTASVYSTKRHEPWAQSYTPASIDSVLRRGYAYTDTVAGRLTQLLWQAGGNMQLRPFRYTPQGDLAWLSDLTIGAQCASFPSASVTDVDGYVCNPTSPTVTRTLGLEYDAARNLTKQVDSVGATVDTAVVAVGNRLTSWSGSTYGSSYTFDADGNMITRTYHGTTTTFSYDGDGLLRRTILGSDTTCYEYTAFDQLVFTGTGCARNIGYSTTARTAHRIYVWDGDHLMAEVDSMAATRFAEYVYRPGVDRPHALLTDSAGATVVRFYHQDMLGNVIGLTRGTTPEQTLAYEPWGELAGITGTLADTNRLRWKGLYWEGGNTQLYYVRHRWYDPEARRFTTEDPIGIEGGMNLYTFAGNDWVNRSDPSGLEQRCYRHWVPPVIVTSFGVAYEYPGYYETRCDDWPDNRIPADPLDEVAGLGGGGSVGTRDIKRYKACGFAITRGLVSFAFDFATVLEGGPFVKATGKALVAEVRAGIAWYTAHATGRAVPTVARLKRISNAASGITDMSGGAAWLQASVLEDMSRPISDSRALSLLDFIPFSSTGANYRAAVDACSPN